MTPEDAADPDATPAQPDDDEPAEATDGDVVSSTGGHGNDTRLPVGGCSLTARQSSPNGGWLLLLSVPWLLRRSRRTRG